MVGDQRRTTLHMRHYNYLIMVMMRTRRSDYSKVAQDDKVFDTS